MSLKVKLKDIIPAIEAFNTLKEVNGIGFKLNYKLYKIHSEIIPIFKSFSEARMKFFKENGEYNEENKSYSIENNKEALEKFEQEMNQLLEEEYELDIKKIDPKEFEDYKIDLDTILKINWIIEHNN